MGEREPRWGPVNRSQSEGVRPGMDGPRTPVSRRSPAEQDFHRAQSKARRDYLTRDADEEARAADVWEARRQELVRNGKVFDNQGNITDYGKALLYGMEWTPIQIATMQELHKNEIGEVEVIREPASVRENATMSAQGRPYVLEDARRRAKQELQERAAEMEAAARRAQGERRAFGLQAYATALVKGFGESDARRQQFEAEQRYDLQRQQKQNLRAAS